MRALYIGEFPPPMGGVTVKNELLKSKVYNNSEMIFFDLYSCKKNPFKLFVLFFEILTIKGRIVLGVGSNKRLYRLLIILGLFGGRKKINNTIIIMMGSTLHKYCEKRKRLLKLLQNVKAIYTESESINQAFGKIGIYNTKFFPNCRERTDIIKNKSLQSGEKIKLVFFSKICREKGADILFKVVQKLVDMKISVALDYYGVIDQQYESEFYEKIKEHEGYVRYCGIFDSSKDDVYKKLNEYHILLFPSTWVGEGVPGILIESKMAGIPAIVSAHNYNNEVVIDREEGLVVKENCVDNFVQAICELYSDTRLYDKLVKGTVESRKRYDIESYKRELLRYFGA